MSADRLTPEQLALIARYREKWQHIGLSTERINQQRATDAVQAIYTALRLSEPEIIFVDSPNAAFEYICNLLPVASQTVQNNAINGFYWSRLYSNLQSNLIVHLPADLQTNLHSLFENHLANECTILLQRQLKKQWKNASDQHHRQLIKNIFSSCRQPESLITGSSYFDFCVYSFNYRQFQNEITILEEFVKNCGWTFFFEKIAIICDRPTIISINSDNHIHPEDAPAIAYADGYSLYAHNGQIKLENPPKPINKIDLVGLLERTNTVEIDSWEDYQLLRVVNQRINVQPTQFLKATNPTTGKVEVSKVPLRITSALEAVHWVNRSHNR